MGKYLTSRVLIVFFVKFTYNWVVNTKSHLIQFFDFSDGYILEIVSYLLMFLFIVLSIFIINISFSILHLTETLSFEQIVTKIKHNGIGKSVKSYVENFWSELSENFEKEVKLERYPNLFIVYILTFQLYPKGNPILNNYYGIYKEYEIERDEYTAYVEHPNYIIHKSKVSEIKGRMRSLYDEFDEDEPYYEVRKRGYLFLQTGLIDGYKSYYKEYKGFLSYIECLLFSIFEKLINTIMYFLIPFILSIMIYHYKFEKK
jgi:hypothetical protein